MMGITYLEKQRQIQEYMEAKAESIRPPVTYYNPSRKEKKLKIKQLGMTGKQYRKHLKKERGNEKHRRAYKFR